jgi:isopentenyl diphosphate isomerase/L-lactate dehydrogenase-like FMN-dependent dehydrogenase
MDLRSLERQARDVLAPELFALIADAAGEGRTARDNERAFRRRALVPRVLRDVSEVRTTTTVLDHEVTAPIGIAPLPRMAGVHAGGERALAEAAAELGLVFCAATNSSVVLEELVLEGGPTWFQLYPHRDAGITSDLVARAEAAGYDALAITLDRPVRGLKASEATKRDDAAAFPNLARYGGADVVSGRYHPAFTWDELARLLQATSLPIVLKGVLAVEDARRAIDLGCAGIWVSNHGGRQLDQSIASLDVLEEIAAVVDGRGEVFLDGGVRRGIDPLIAASLGADGVFLGRPLAYALAVGGCAGVRDALATLTAELAQAMALLGVARIDQLARERVR